MTKNTSIAVLPNGATLDLLIPNLRQAWPVDRAPAFADLLQAVDDADRELGWKDRRGAQPLE